MKRCAVCEKEFEPVQRHQLYCSQKCKRRIQTIRRNESGWTKKWESKRLQAARIGLHIRDEALNQPTKASKSLWDGIGRWSKAYPECVECSRTTYKHRAHGICERCYEQMRRAERKDDPKYKAKKAESDARNKRTTTMRKVGKTWIERAKNGEIEQTPTIKNLLSNL